MPKEHYAEFLLSVALLVFISAFFFYKIQQDHRAVPPASSLLREMLMLRKIPGDKADVS
jgi:hypothetical protein